MHTWKTAGYIALLGGLLTAACGDSSQSLNPTAPSSAIVADGTALTDAESGTAAKGGDKGKPDDAGKPDDKGKDDKDKDKGKDPPSPGAPSGTVHIEGLIGGITGSSITVNSQTVLVPLTAVIRHGNRAVAFSELKVGDRVHVKASRVGTALEAREVKLQNPGGGDGDDDDDDREQQGSVWVTLFDATASESGTDTGTFRLNRSGSTTLPLTSPLTVTFTLTGTALNGTDYTSVPLTVTFAAGAATVDVVVRPTADGLAEGSETVILTLTVVSPYRLGRPATATITIAD